MTEFMVQPNLCCSPTMRAKQKESVEIDYDYFFTSVTKARANNYLRVMGDIMCLKPGRTFKFSNGAPNPRCFPYEEFTVKLKNGNSFQINGKDLNESLGYGSNNGYQPLVDVLQNYQERLHDNVDWNKKALSTVAGSQSGLYQAIEMFVSPGDPVLIQSPLYSGVIAALQPLNVEYLEVDSNDNGMCPREVEKILNERKEKNLPMPKIFYVNPTGTNPTGDVMSNQRKKEIYEIACRYNLLILEDDPYFLIRYNDVGVKSSIEKVSSFLSMDSENRVVRFDSASKTLAAGFRIGFVTAAKTIIDKLNIVKSVSSMCPPFTQMVAYKTLTTLGFEGFLNHTHCSSQFYNKCANIVLQSLDEHLKDVATWIIPKAAFFVWIYIKNIDHVPESFIHKCIDNLVLLVPGFAFYAKPRKSPFIRLAFSMLEEDEIKEGIQILARLIKEDLLK